MDIYHVGGWEHGGRSAKGIVVRGTSASAVAAKEETQSVQHGSRNKAGRDAGRIDSASSPAVGIIGNHSSFKELNALVRYGFCPSIGVRDVKRTSMLSPPDLWQASIFVPNLTGTHSWKPIEAY
jgi:hypothetical protein